MNYVETESLAAADLPLAGRVAVVTGSTSGIGLGIARALAEAGADLVINGLGKMADIERTWMNSARSAVRSNTIPQTC